MSANITIYNPEGLAAPLGKYSHVARAKASEHLYIAGQVAVDSAGGLVGEGDIEAQVRQVFANLRTALRSADADFGNIVKFTTFLVGADHLPGFMRARDVVFRECFPGATYPPNTLLVIDRLVKAEFLVEIEAVAAI